MYILLQFLFSTYIITYTTKFQFSSPFFFLFLLFYLQWKRMPCNHQFHHHHHHRNRNGSRSRSRNRNGSGSGSGSRSRSRSRSCDRNRSTKVLGFPVPSWLTLFFRVWDAAGIDVCGSWRSRAVGVANCQGSAAKKEWFHQNHCVRNMLNSIMFTFSCLVIHTHTQEERK